MTGRDRRCSDKCLVLRVVRSGEAVRRHHEYYEWYWEDDPTATLTLSWCTTLANQNGAKTEIWAMSERLPSPKGSRGTRARAGDPVQDLQDDSPHAKLPLPTNLLRRSEPVANHTGSIAGAAVVAFGVIIELVRYLALKSVGSALPDLVSLVSSLTLPPSLAHSLPGIVQLANYEPEGIGFVNQING
ncbi:hypothetical protein V8E55_006271 [Tylopilus felleus]